MRLVSFAYALTAILLLAIAETCLVAAYFGGAAIALAAGMASFYVAVTVELR